MQSPWREPLKRPSKTLLGMLRHSFDCTAIFRAPLGLRKTTVARNPWQELTSPCESVTAQMSSALPNPIVHVPESRLYVLKGCLLLGLALALIACEPGEPPPVPGEDPAAEAATALATPTAAPTPAVPPRPTPTTTATPTATVTPRPTPTAVTPTSTVPPRPTPTPFATYIPQPITAESDPFVRWNEIVADMEPQAWWRPSTPYSCVPAAKTDSPWLRAGMTDLGGDDELSLIRWYGNGSYLRYGFMELEGCTRVTRQPSVTHQDPPADPTYYSLGNLDISVDIARVPRDAKGWFEDDGSRESMSMGEAVALLNRHIAPYYARISEGKLTLRFLPGVEFQVGGDGSYYEMDQQYLPAVGIRDCRRAAAMSEQCSYGGLGGLNRILLTDVSSDSGGYAANGFAGFSLASLREAHMSTVIHEIGHGWMLWPHSYAELLGSPYPDGELGPPNPYSNHYDFMSRLVQGVVPGWIPDTPSTLAVNRYAAGWIPPSEVALHRTDSGVYTLQPPRTRGNQFLVISSGRPYAFTTLEVLDDRSDDYRNADWPRIYDRTAPDEFRLPHFEGVFVSRYDQTTGTGVNARLGPALYNEENPDYLTDVYLGNDDYSLITDGESRDIGGGVRVQALRNDDGSYTVMVTGGRVAPFPRWCRLAWFRQGEEYAWRYDAFCALDAPDSYVP